MSGWLGTVMGKQMRKASWVEVLRVLWACRALEMTWETSEDQKTRTG